MNLASLQVSAFADLLGSDAPAPGGGSAAALEGALGASLTAMVCALTLGKKKYADAQDLAAQTLDRASDLKVRFLDVMDRDTQAFNAVSAVFAMPKGTPEEKQLRASAMQNALKGCTETPFEMMELALETLELTGSILGRTNASAASDLGVSALSLKAAIQGAWLNVRINIASLQDRELAESFRIRGEALLERALPLADRIYETVLASL